MKEILLNRIFDYFLPRFCPACNQKLNPQEDIICNTCVNKLKLTSDKLISVEYQKKFALNKLISDFHPLFIFEKESEIQHIIHSLKYNKHFRVGIFLGKVIGETLKDKFKSWQIDIIIPVPLHQLKKAERGFNQSDFISKGISLKTGIRWNKKIISRKRFTQTQTHLTAEERKANVKDAFKVKNSLKIKGKNLLLVDDVITTGSTISECACQLLKAGANKIYATSVAIAE